LENIPLTVFLTAQEGANYEDFITGYPSLAYNLSLNNVEYQTAGYINQPYTEIPINIKKG